MEAGVMTKAQTFTLGKLMACGELGLRFAYEPLHAGSRGLSGAHCVDLLPATPWIERDWLVLTSGTQLRDEASCQEFVSELFDTGVAALAFALGTVHRTVPVMLLHAAQEVGLPLITVPFETPFRNVTSLVFRAIANTDAATSGRLVSMQRFFIDALMDPRPQDVLLNRLGVAVDASVAVVDAAGRASFDPHDLPIAAIGHEIGRRPGPNIALKVGGMRGFGLARGWGEHESPEWLVLMWPVDKPIPTIARPAAHVAHLLWIATELLELREATKSRSVRRATLASLIAPGLDSPRMLQAQGRALGVNIDDGTILIVLAQAKDPDPDSLLGRTEQVLEQFGVPYLATVIREHVAVLLRDPVSDAWISDGLLGAERSVRVGIGRKVMRAEDVPSAWRDATVAVEEPTQRARRRIVHYEDLDLGTVLLNEIPAERLRPRFGAMAATLQRHPAVYDTLTSYLTHNMDVARAARSMGVHANTIRYRLGRAEEIIGMPLRSSSTIVALHVVLMLGSAPVVGAADVVPPTE